MEGDRTRYMMESEVVAGHLSGACVCANTCGLLGIPVLGLLLYTNCVPKAVPVCLAAELCILRMAGSLASRALLKPDVRCAMPKSWERRSR